MKVLDHRGPVHCTHLLSLLVDWEVAGLDAQHPTTTETQHVLGGKEKCTIIYLRGRKVVWLRVNMEPCSPTSQWVFQATLFALGS